jgi:precorrin-2 dehydrogenase/sirohydrochlorin ferrochelatase
MESAETKHAVDIERPTPIQGQLPPATGRIADTRESAPRNPATREAPLFPVFLKLEGRLCLVVGAGQVALSKIDGLLASGAKVHVVAPQAIASLSEWASAGKISWEQRKFEPADLDGVFLVVVAASHRELNERVFNEAQRRGVLCNVVDDPPNCDFYYPSVVRRGDLQIAISTNGCSPALARRLRHELEQQFGPEYEAWLRKLGSDRNRLFQQAIDPEYRRELLHKMAAQEEFEAFLRRHRDEVIEESNER